MVRVAIATLCLAFTFTAFAAEEGGTGVTSHRDKTLALMPLDVELSLLTASGITEPRAEWTEAAKEHMTNYTRDSLMQREVGFVDGSDISGDEMLDVLSLHEVVGPVIMNHHYVEKLPTKEGKLDWSLGDEAAVLGRELKADYGLFIYIRDSYASGGRVAMQVLGALGGVTVTGGFQIGFASLVDLKTGEIVWFNRLIRGAGDLREADKAEGTMNLLLKDFPV